MSSWILRGWAVIALAAGCAQESGTRAEELERSPDASRSSEATAIGATGIDSVVVYQGPDDREIAVTADTERGDDVYAMGLERFDPALPAEYGDRGAPRAAPPTRSERLAAQVQRVLDDVAGESVALTIELDRPATSLLELRAADADREEIRLSSRLGGPPNGSLVRFSAA